MMAATTITTVHNSSCTSLWCSQSFPSLLKQGVKLPSDRLNFVRFSSIKAFSEGKKGSCVKAHSEMHSTNMREREEKDMVCSTSTVDSVGTLETEVHSEQALFNQRSPFTIDRVEPSMLIDHSVLTGGAFDFKWRSITPLSRPKTNVNRVILVRHGLSSWNGEGRVQGSSDLSVLSEKGMNQVRRCKAALSKINFDQCFASPISRAKSSAEILWSDREEPIIFLDSLREAHLHCLEGMLNSDAKEQYPELFRSWREDPANFHVDGVYPIVQLWTQARNAWEVILSSNGECVLVVTHKSMLRALICTALGMPPESFRAIDINNAGVSMFSINKHGNPMLQNLNLTSHLYADDINYF